VFGYDAAMLKDNATRPTHRHIALQHSQLSYHRASPGARVRGSSLTAGSATWTHPLPTVRTDDSHAVYWGQELFLHATHTALQRKPHPTVHGTSVLAVGRSEHAARTFISSTTSCAASKLPVSRMCSLRTCSVPCGTLMMAGSSTACVGEKNSSSTLLVVLSALLLRFSCSSFQLSLALSAFACNTREVTVAGD
jgi:hypothetical protein